MGSPKFPRSPSEDMPRSETPVVSHPRANTRLRLLPSGGSRPSACPLHTLRDILWSTILSIARLDHAACILVPSSFVRPLRGVHVEFPTDLRARRSSGGA
jgi:hypothetical protein